MCCDDAYHVTPRVSALAGCDRLVSKLGYREAVSNDEHFLVMSSPAPRRFSWEIVYPPPRPKWFIDLKTGYRMKRTGYRHHVPVTTHPFQTKEKSPERVPAMESEEDPEEDPKEDPEEDS
ncbi:hypothetical protein Tco_0009250 [Tanacetum coccineum]